MTRRLLARNYILLPRVLAHLKGHSRKLDSQLPRGHPHPSGDDEGAGGPADDGRLDLPARHAVQLGPAGVGEDPLPPGLVLFARYSEGASWRPQRLTPGRAVLDLLANTLPARRQPGAALNALEKVARAAPAYRVERGEAEESVESILGLLEQTADDPG